jgi:hypothetical protein
MTNSTITLELQTIGRATATVDRARYEQSKADGTLDHLLDRYLSNMDETTTVTEPDGTTFDPTA